MEEARGDATRAALVVTARPRRAVIFDWAGTVTVPMLDVFAPLVRRAGLDGDALLGAFLEAEADQTGQHVLHRVERGETGAEDLAAWLDDLSPGAGDLFRLDSPLGFVHQAADRPEVLEAARRWRRGGHRTAICTNNVRELQPVLTERYGATFDVIVNSAIVGLRKPDPAIFEHTLVELGGVDPAAAVFIDDNEGHVDAARSFGMAAVLMTSDTSSALDEVAELLLER